MGYVPPKSTIDAVLTGTKKEANEAMERIQSGYDSYKRGMRSGIFGAIVGKSLFSDPDKNKPTTKGQKND